MKFLDRVCLPDGRIEEWFAHGDGKLTCKTTQAVEPVLEYCKSSYNDAPTRFPGDMNKVASFPPVLIEHIINTRGISFRELMDAKSDFARSIWNELLNSREFRYFRTRPGLVDVKQR